MTSKDHRPRAMLSATSYAIAASPTGIYERTHDFIVPILVIDS